MNALRAVVTVLRFECRRTMVVSRLAFSLLLASFPPVMIGLVKYLGGRLEQDVSGTVALFVMIPGLTCMMGMLLWAVPVIQSEVEGRTWTYLAVRPGGKNAVLLGKYLTAVVWTVATAWLSLAASLLVLRPENEPWQTAWALAALSGLSCIAYGGLYILLGVLFLRRGMVIAVAYTFGVEILTAFVPAVVHQLTIQYHLRCLLSKWVSWPELPPAVRLNVERFFSDDPSWQHLLILACFTAITLTAAVLILRQRELIKPEKA